MLLSPCYNNLFNRNKHFEVSENNSEFAKFLDLVEYCFVSFTKIGEKEGREYERIIYFHPNFETIDKQTNITCFAEAVVNFTGSVVSLTDDDPSKTYSSIQYDYRYIASNNSNQVIIIIEEFLIGTSLNKKYCKDHEYYPHMPTIRALLIKAYEIFRLLYGSFSTQVLCNDNYKTCMEHFFSSYFMHLRVNKAPLIDLFSGVDFMPLSNINYLELDCLMTRSMQEFSVIKKSHIPISGASYPLYS